MKKISKRLFVAFALLLGIFTCPPSVKAQNIILNEADKKTLLTNLSKIIAAVKTDFATLKKGESYLNGNNTLSWQSAVVLFPAYTSNENYLLYFHSYNSKPMPSYTENVQVDIYSVLEVIVPFLKSKGFAEVDPRGLNTDWAGRSFRSNDAVVQLATDTKAAKANTVIDIGKFHYYYEKNSSVDKSNKLGQLPKGSTPEPVLKTNPATGKNDPTPGAKKSFGFMYTTNGKDTMLIKKVFADGPALKAGLKQGDLIQKMNNISVANKTLAELGEIIAKTESSLKLSVLRNQKPLSLSIDKDYLYKFDRTCLSGDCINGTGVSLSKIVDGQMLEGVFKDGELINGSWYVNAKSLQQKGIRVRQGQLTEGRYFTGNIYDGSKPNGGWWYQVVNHDLLRFNKITSDNFNGEVKCYTNDNNSRYIWEGEFVDGRKEGFFYEYLYDKNLVWSYKVSNGIRSNQRLKYLGNDKNIPWTLGTNLEYDSLNKTWSGKFSNQDCCYEELTGVSSFNDLNDKYERKRGGVASNNTNGNTVPQRTTPAKPKVDPKTEEEMTNALSSLNEWLKRSDPAGIADMTQCGKDMNYGESIASMSGHCKRAKVYLNGIIDRCNDFLKKYEKYAPAEAISVVKARLTSASEALGLMPRR